MSPLQLFEAWETDGMEKPFPTLTDQERRIAGMLHPPLVEAILATSGDKLKLIHDFFYGFLAALYSEKPELSTYAEEIRESLVCVLERIFYRLTLIEILFYFYEKKQTPSGWKNLEQVQSFFKNRLKIYATLISRVQKEANIRMPCPPIDLIREHELRRELAWLRKHPGASFRLKEREQIRRWEKLEKMEYIEFVSIDVPGSTLLGAHKFARLTQKAQEIWLPEDPRNPRTIKESSGEQDRGPSNDEILAMSPPDKQLFLEPD